VRRFLLLFLTLVVSPMAGWSASPSCDTPTYDGRYCRFQMQGWTVEINERLVRENSQVVKTTLEILTEQLAIVVEKFPPSRVSELRRILIWVEPSSPDGEVRAAYHTTGSVQPLQNGYPSAKLGAVDFRNARSFINARKTQPAIVAHELTHAYHELILGHEHPGLRAAYRNAVDNSLYRTVLRNNGARERAYALENEREYFAELTEAFFGTNDYFPFNRAELQEYDPLGFEAVRAAWHDVRPVVQRDLGGTDNKCVKDEVASPGSSRQTRLIIRNARSEPISLFWIDFQGKRRLDMTVAPGALGSERTFAGHRFRIEDGAENCLASVVIGEAVSWVDVQP
jgi:hypothetical protein